MSSREKIPSNEEELEPQFREEVINFLGVPDNYVPNFDIDSVNSEIAALYPVNDFLRMETGEPYAQYYLRCLRRLETDG